MKKPIIFLLWICITLSVLPQSNAENIRKSRPLGVAANLGGGSLLGVSVDYFIIPQLNIEAGFGLSQYIALKYHFAGGEDIKWSPYLGFGYGIPIADIREYDEKYSNGVFAIPIGAHFIQQKGFSFSVEGILGIVHYKELSTYDYSSFEEKTQLFPSFGIRLGYHFNTSGK